MSSKQLADWILLNYKKYGINIEFITDKSSDGCQFCKGFGGIGGFLRYKIDVDEIVVMLLFQYSRIRRIIFKAFYDSVNNFLNFLGK